MPRKTTKADRSEALTRARDRIALEGAEAAVAALIEVCRDPKAAAPARATAGTALLRAGGLFDRRDDDAADVPIEEMTAEQLAAAIAELKRDLLEHSAATVAPDDWGEVNSGVLS